MTGPQSRHKPAPQSATTTITSSVTPAVTGAAAGGAPAGTAARLPRTREDTDTGISISTVPATIGVKIRRSTDSLAARTNWNRDEMTIRVASSPGPPCSSAVTQMARKALLLPISST